LRSRAASAAPAASGLDLGYRARAVPAGSARYWAWLFAAPPARDALLGIQALTAEWRAETDPSVERGVAHLKLAWWQEEIERLTRGAPVHPISRYLAALPGADGPLFQPLAAAVAAAVDEVSGVPLESALDLPAHAMALRGEPLLAASRLTESWHDAPVAASSRASPSAPSVAPIAASMAAPSAAPIAASSAGPRPASSAASRPAPSAASRPAPSAASSAAPRPAPSAAPSADSLSDLRDSIRALAAAEHLAEALADYRRLARSGRVPFPVDELLAAGIETTDLCADAPPERLSGYLQQLKARAAGGYRAASAALPAARRGRHRHLLVLAALGLRRLDRSPMAEEATTSAMRRLKDMLLAWQTARGAR
jgi:phytoene/squalene synthetase